MGSMYSIFTYIYHKKYPNVGRYTIPMDPMGNHYRSGPGPIFWLFDEDMLMVVFQVRGCVGGS